MGTEAGTAFVGLEFKRGDLAALESQNRSAGSRFASGWAGFAKTAVLGIGAAFGAMKAIDFVSGAISQASDLNESVTKVQRVFGDAGQSVIDFSTTTATSLGQSQNEALAAAGTFGNLFRALKLGEGQSAQMSTRLVTLAGDLASFNNVDPAEALDALRSGLVGETEPLRRFGVNMNDATLRAEALKLGLLDAGDTGGTALDPAIKAQAAYALILDQTKLAQGDFARTSGGLANQQRILSAQWENLQTQLGGILLPLVVRVVSAFNGAIPALRSVGGAITTVVQAIAAGDIGGALRRDFDAVAGATGAVVDEIGDLVGIFQGAREAGDSFGEAINITAVNALHDFGLSVDQAASVVTTLTTVLGATATLISGAFSAIGDNLDVVLTLVGAFVAYQVAMAAVNATLAAYRVIQAVVATIQVLSAGGTAALAVAQQAQATAAGEAASAQTVLNIALLANPIGLVIVAVVALVAAVVLLYRNNETARQIIQTAWAGIAQIVTTTVTIVVAIIRALVTVGTALWQRFGGAITTIARTQFQTIVAVIRGVMQVVKGVINVALGLIHGDWSRVWQGIQQITTGAMGIIRAIITGAVKIFFAAARALGAAILDGIKAGIQGIGAFVKGKIAAIPSFLGDVSRLLFDAGTKIIQGLIDGITSKIGAVKDAVGSVASAVTDHFPNSPQAKVGPLADHHPETMGERIANQLAAGLTSGAPAVAGASNDLAGLVAGGEMAAPRMATAAFGGGGVVAAGAAPGPGEVRVFIGDRELTDIVRVEVRGHGERTARRVKAGSRWG